MTKGKRRYARNRAPGARERMRMQDITWSIVRIGVAVYLGLCLLMFFRQAKYVYYPDKIVSLTPEMAGMTYEDVNLHTADGETIHGWYVPASPSKLTLLFCHGNAGNIGHRIVTLQLFHELGLNVYIFDYRGYGRSSGQPTEAGTYLDAGAAWDYLVEGRHVAPTNIVVFGESLGGAVAAWVAGQKRPGALILESTFTSMPDMAACVYPFLPVRWLCRFRYEALTCLKNVRCPVLVAHSPDDETVPFAQGQRLFAAAAEPKQFLTLRGSHNAGREETGAAYTEGLGGFLRRYLGP
jgi:uncharacterized protein